MRSLIRFGMTGVLATLTHIAVFITLVEWLQLRPVWAAGPAFLRIDNARSASGLGMIAMNRPSLAT